MNVYSEEEIEPLESHCQKYIHQYKCDDAMGRSNVCSTCPNRHRTFVELSDVLQIISDPALKKQINNLSKYMTY